MAVAIPARLPLFKLFFNTNTKSAPGLITIKNPEGHRLSDLHFYPTAVIVENDIAGIIGLTYNRNEFV